MRRAAEAALLSRVTRTDRYDQLPTAAVAAAPIGQQRKKLPALIVTPGVPEAPGWALALICGMTVPPALMVMTPRSSICTFSVADVDAAVTATAEATDAKIDESAVSALAVAV
jgi:hypothetical protein